MNLQAQLDQFRDDNPYDPDTQAKRLLASDNKPLILHVLALGFATAKQRQHHIERDYMKNIGSAPSRGRIVSGRTTGSIKIVPTKRMQNLTKQFLADVWMVGDKKLGDCSRNDLTVAINREQASAAGHGLNVTFYTEIRKNLEDNELVRQRWNEQTIRAKIEETYGEFRKTAAA